MADLGYVAVALLLPWPAAIGVRRFYQGVMIRHGRTRRVAYGTVLRLVTMASTALLLSRVEGMHGAWVGCAALSAGVIAEALASRVMAAPVIRGLVSGEIDTDDPAQPLSTVSIARFYYPLVLMTLLSMGIQPMVSFFLARSIDAIDSLAVMPVVLALVFVFRALGLAYQEVGIALIGEQGEGYRPLRRFAITLGVVAGGGLVLVGATPLASVWFGTISGLSPELAFFAVLPTQVLALMPALTVWLSFQRAMLVVVRNTMPITWATGLEVLGALAGLWVGVVWLGVSGALAGAAALMLGRVLAVGYLLRPAHAARRKVVR